MNNIRNPRTTLAAALATSLLFVAGGAFANDPAGQDRTAQDQAATADAQDTTRTGEQDRNLTNTEQLNQADSDQPVDDTWITTKVKASLLADDETAGTRIEVETNNGVVALSGNVESQAEIDAAKRIVGGIEGVVDVDTSDLNYGTMGNYEE
jgi:hyperosmotically inducible protein